MSDIELKRKWDWVGLVVRGKRPLGNSVGTLPEGSLYFVDYQHGGATIQSRPCECCGLVLTIRKVPLHDLEPVARIEGPLEFRRRPRTKPEYIDWSQFDEGEHNE